MGIKSGIKRYIRGSVLNSRICLSWSDRLSVVRGEKMAFTDISGFLEVRSRCALVLAGGVCAYDLFFGGFCETVGQIFYMAVLFSDFSVGMVIISAYCAISVLWSRVFLKEKMSWKHYLMIALVISGIVILG